MDLRAAYICVYALLLFVAGYFLPGIKRKSLARIYAWMLAIVTVVLSVWLTSGEAAYYV